MDVGPREESLCGDVGEGGIVVLRSFGKFFGLAGVRLGFAVTSPDMAKRLDDRLGPWAVAGPALEYGIAALGDAAWADAMRVRLREDAERLDALFASLRFRGRWRHRPVSPSHHAARAAPVQGARQRGHSDPQLRRAPERAARGPAGLGEEWARLEAGLAGFSAGEGGSR